MRRARSNWVGRWRHLLLRTNLGRPMACSVQSQQWQSQAQCGGRGGEGPGRLLAALTAHSMRVVRRVVCRQGALAAGSYCGAPVVEISPCRTPGSLSSK
jgi:hypothetical protein